MPDTCQSHEAHEEQLERHEGSHKDHYNHEKDNSVHMQRWYISAIGGLFTVGVGIALAVGGSVIYFMQTTPSRSEVHAEIKETKGDLRDDIAAVQQQVADGRKETKEDLKDLKETILLIKKGN